MTLALPAKAAIAGLGLTLLGLVSSVANALESDASAPIEIVADRLELDNRAGTAVYIGDVEMQQGSMKLTADRVEIERNDQGEVSLVTAIGESERAYLEQKPAPDDPIVRGWGRTVIYHADQRRVELIDQAELHQGGDTFRGAYVEYFLDRRQVQARSETGGGERERVRMTLTPQSAQ
ncbi:lipopolysaccharide transport periplasmic protein LptA [Halomonas sp. McH1-25]|uniref:lipopolysaccharide transport periplasmic protein LptA n=1 Tax=unclassified Halomonas TaxID=2609666 RepID=UPI001EF521F1|nr:MULTISPECIES: lipopolysaccharide transport periplasmic protein LptA [unclassified Halomonas]MCG7598994.1 lipopolysaccharide transport periplasmic protein LptA [Halomonas sp. McH1-25]MCP1342402.1 lipopolysaccharide transport periplasmic protein LptA [Halomonas sp. FL8]MCP1360359.1 lipopolysaccharide transport periplasmic protein LptA [Halomonas sp. BBD45]MCP1364369.1 lipopolysaccharide transport periplasmic protein LptA [Halomonas sp. BBD48]